MFSVVLTDTLIEKYRNDKQNAGENAFKSRNKNILVDIKKRSGKSLKSARPSIFAKSRFMSPRPERDGGLDQSGAHMPYIRSRDSSPNGSP